MVVRREAGKGGRESNFNANNNQTNIWEKLKIREEWVFREAEKQRLRK